MIILGSLIGMVIGLFAGAAIAFGIMRHMLLALICGLILASPIILVILVILWNVFTELLHPIWYKNIPTGQPNSWWVVPRWEKYSNPPIKEVEK